MDLLTEILSTQAMWGAIIATISFVLIGYLATKKNILSKETNGRLSKFTINFILPFLCISAFMQKADASKAIEIGIVLGLSVAFYVIFSIMSWVITNYFPKLIPNYINRKAEELFHEKNLNSENPITKEYASQYIVNNYRAKLTTTQMMIVYGSLQFFAYPLIKSLATTPIFDSFTLALAQTWCIPFMIGAFSIVPIMYSGEKFNRKHLTPIAKSLLSPMMICLYISLILWSIQFIPFFQNSTNKYINNFWGNFGSNFPFINKTIQTGTSIVSPLAWIVIGGSLAASNLKEAVKDKMVWITTARKLMVLPAFIFVVTLILVIPFTNKLNVVNYDVVSQEVAQNAAYAFEHNNQYYLVKSAENVGLISRQTGVMLVLLAATPPATTCVLFATNYKHPYTGYTAEVSSLSTLLAIIAMPLWILISYLTYTSIVRVNIDANNFTQAKEFIIQALQQVVV